MISVTSKSKLRHNGLLGLLDVRCKIHSYENLYRVRRGPTIGQGSALLSGMLARTTLCDRDHCLNVLFGMRIAAFSLPGVSSCPGALGCNASLQGDFQAVCQATLVWRRLFPCEILRHGNGGQS